MLCKGNDHASFHCMLSMPIRGKSLCITMMSYLAHTVCAVKSCGTFYPSMQHMAEMYIQHRGTAHVLCSLWVYTVLKSQMSSTHTCWFYGGQLT